MKISVEDWKERYVERLVVQGIDRDFAVMCSHAVDPAIMEDETPEDAADDEIFYMSDA